MLTNDGITRARDVENVKVKIHLESNEQRANKEKCYEMLLFIHFLNRPRADGLKAIFREKAYFFVP